MTAQPAEPPIGAASERIAAHLREQGVRVLGEPTASKGPAEGNRWIYFLAPWGMQFELVCYPNGKTWDREHPQYDGQPQGERP